MLTEHIWSVRAVALPSRWSCERGENGAWMTSHLQSQENLADSGNRWPKTAGFGNGGKG